MALAGLRRTRVRQTAHRVETVRATLAEGWDFVRNVPLFRFLALVTLAMIVCETFLEFHFLVVTEQTFDTAASYQTFYSLYRLGLTVASIALQAFLTSRIIDRIGLKNAFLILPIMALAGATWMLAAATSIVSAVGGVVMQKLPQFTVDESARKSFGFPPKHPHMQRLMGIALWVGMDVRGSIYVTDPEDGAAFDDDDERMLLTLGQHASSVIQHRWF